MKILKGAFAPFISLCFWEDYLLSLPPPDGLPVVLGHPPLPFAIAQKNLIVIAYSISFSASASIKANLSENIFGRYVPGTVRVFWER